MLRSTLLPIMICLLGTACATGAQSSEQSDNSSSSSIDRAVGSTQSGFTEAALTPIEDLNLKRDEIPLLLRQIKDPYLVPADTSCEALSKQVIALDAILGRDWDVPVPEDDRSLGDQAADGTSSALLDTIASEAGGIIPFRGIVRTVTGAKAWNKKVLRAYERGSHRRTFLKGLGYANGCAPPAAPLPPPPEEQKIFYK